MVEVGGFELAAGAVTGLILISVATNIGAAITKVYFEPWLRDFKARHDRVINGIRGKKK